MTADSLRALADLREGLQKTRVAFQNRIDAIERGADQADARTLEILRFWKERLEEIEGVVSADIAELSQSIPIIQRMIAVKGCGLILAARIVAHIGDIRRFPTVSKLWRFAGYAVIDGRAERMRKGEKAHYNRRLKVACWVLASSLIRSDGPYRVEYDRAREHYDRTHPEWSADHKHKAAMRKVIKLFLAHLWEAWRELEGLDIRPPYALERLGHTTMKSRFEYGWGR